MEVATAYTEFRQSLITYIRSKIRSREDASDILQNVFTKITSNRNSLEGKNDIRKWLFIVTRNAIIDYYRTHTPRQKLLTAASAADDAIDEDAIDTTQGLDKCVHSMIQLLPDNYRSIVIDSEIEGIRQTELAIKYNMSYSSLRSRVQRGREKLKELFYECCAIETDHHGNILESIPKKRCDDACDPQ